MIALDDVIEYLIYTEYIPFHTLKHVLYINKSIYSTVTDIIDTHCTNYSTGKTFRKEGIYLDTKSNEKHMKCEVCDIVMTKRLHPFHHYPLCKSCSKEKLIHKTTAKKKYCIKDKDLKRLNYHCYHRSIYRLGCVYDIDSIIYIHYINSIIESKKAYREPKKIPKKIEREERVRCLIQKEYGINDEDNIYYILSSQPIFYYIKNGSYGIKKVKNVIRQWVDFHNFILNDEYAMEVINDLNINDYFDRYILHPQKTIDIIHTRYDSMMKAKKREEMLIHQLIEYNIVDEYKCTAFYEFISDVNKDLEEALDEIREHHFFMCHTSFISERMKRLRDSDIVSDDQIQMILMDTDNVSKINALHHLDTKDIPDFIKNKYL